MNTYHIANDSLIHYGVKGMKWGVRKTPINNRGKLQKKKVPHHTIHNGKKIIENFNKRLSETKVADGTKVNKATKHVIKRMLERKIKANSIVDSLEKPLYISDEKVNAKGSSKQYIGEEATSVVNPNKETVVTTWSTGSRQRKRYKKGGK